MGSVKDLTIIKKPTSDQPGRGRFVFSDRYSVFDWGEMPDHIEDKGAAICLVTAYFFEKLEEAGIKTHYRGIVENGKAKKLMELEQPSNILEIDLVRVIKPKVKGDSYDYTPLKEQKANFLIPIEIIYRNSLPASSSVFKRLKSGQLQLEDIGLDKMPEPGQKLKPPILDVSTKLEMTDRYISWEEAQQICNLSNQELNNIKQLLLTVDDHISREVEKIGLTNEDGKIELGFDENREIMVVDALGTLDESRFTFDGKSVSKEIARKYYRNTEWSEKINSAKKQNRLNWKDLVKTPPPPLPEKLSQAISNIYKAYANEITGRNWFETSSLHEILEEIEDIK
mgnify:CR=1 FL=1